VVSSTARGQMYDAFGAYVRSQRQLARLTLRQAAALAHISNPYLSQIEHGLALPSITVIGALADALSVSAETLLLQAAGVVSPDTAERSSHTEDAIRQDPRLDDGQKHALLAVLTSFLGSSGAVPAEPVRARANRTGTSGRPAAAGAASSRRRRT
jgi:transcriptional regulator with XRE-family HTH domain